MILQKYLAIGGVNWLSIIQNSIEKTDYRLWIDIVDNRKLPWLKAICHSNLLEHIKNI